MAVVESIPSKGLHEVADKNGREYTIFSWMFLPLSVPNDLHSTESQIDGATDTHTGLATTHCLRFTHD